jgi:hypothetical protein
VSLPTAFQLPSNCLPTAFQLPVCRTPYNPQGVGTPHTRLEPGGRSDPQTSSFHGMRESKSERKAKPEGRLDRQPPRFSADAWPSEITASPSRVSPGVGSAPRQDHAVLGRK